MFCKTYNESDFLKFRWESALYKAVDEHDVYSDYEWQSCMWMKLIKINDIHKVLYYSYDKIHNVFTTDTLKPFSECLDLLGCVEDTENELIIFDDINTHILNKDFFKSLLTRLNHTGIISFASNKCSFQELDKLGKIAIELDFVCWDCNPQFNFLKEKEKLIATFNKHEFYN